MLLSIIKIIFIRNKYIDVSYRYSRKFLVKEREHRKANCFFAVCHWYRAAAVTERKTTTAINLFCTVAPYESSTLTTTTV